MQAAPGPASHLLPLLTPVPFRGWPFLLRKEALQVLHPPTPKSSHEGREGRGRREVMAIPDTGAEAPPAAGEDGGIQNA